MGVGEKFKKLEGFDKKKSDIYQCSRMARGKPGYFVCLSTPKQLELCYKLGIKTKIKTEIKIILQEKNFN